MKTTITFATIKDSAAMFFHRYHIIIFFLVVSVGLLSALLVLVSIINLSATSAAGDTNQVTDSFDQDTIDRVRMLGGRSASQPGDRASPFVE